MSPNTVCKLEMLRRMKKRKERKLWSFIDLLSPNSVESQMRKETVTKE